jgi:hypothetical protein
MTLEQFIERFRHAAPEGTVLDNPVAVPPPSAGQMMNGYVTSVVAPGFTFPSKTCTVRTCGSPDQT